LKGLELYDFHKKRLELYVSLELYGFNDKKDLSYLFMRIKRTGAIGFNNIKDLSYMFL